jgi:cellulose synthase (UDP-forming)
MPQPYFTRYENRRPPVYPALSRRRAALWHFLAGVTLALGGWYLHWRWTQSLNPEAPLFSAAVALAETLCYAGTLIFFYDIWDEGDTPRRQVPGGRSAAGLETSGQGGAILVDIFITTYDEDSAIVAPSVRDALAVRAPECVRVSVHVLDDGNRADIAALARDLGAGYITRTSNTGFKAGNLRNALCATNGDFVVICDADTRLFPAFLENTLGYFSDPKVAWVQTPHWFYDIPEGERWADWLARRFGPAARRFGKALGWLTGRPMVGADPFLSDPSLFFDVIQRRRNRNRASFCCGAGSVHRREAVFSAALKRKCTAVDARLKQLGGTRAGLLAKSVELEPYKFHVSEDIYTSILLQGDKEEGWISIYHPQVESRMLSPWGIHAWAAQKLKYAGGTFDIMLHDNPLRHRGLPLAVKLHYLATFWSYATAFWTAVLLFAPVVSLFTGLAPVEAYSAEFFARFLPVILANELAVMAGCKGHAVQPGRILSVATLDIQLRAFWMVLRGRRPKFAPTPKTPLLSGGLRFAGAGIAMLALMSTAAAYGLAMAWSGAPGYGAPFLAVNLFWLSWNALAAARVVTAALWRPPASPSPLSQTKEKPDGTLAKAGS